MLWKNSVSIFNIESDDIKEKIIVGRSQHPCLEAATEESGIRRRYPGSIIISGLDPVRREIARLVKPPRCRDGRHTPHA